MNITTGELRILKLILESDYQDYAELTEAIGYQVWSVAENNEDKGFMSSCVKKGLIGVNNADKGSEVCWITAEGLNAYNTNK